MLRTLIPVVAAALAALLTPGEARAWGAMHVGYTHVGPYGAYHYGGTAVGGYGYRYGGYGYGYRPYVAPYAPYAASYNPNSTSLFPNLPPVTGGLAVPGGVYNSGVYRLW